MNSIALAYAGVHQIFQLALAAHEVGELDSLYCSVVNGNRKWGRRLGRWVPAGTAQPLGSDTIPQERMIEFPWPILANRLTKKLLPRRRNDHLRSNTWFDRSAANWLSGRKAKVFIGVETCALQSLMRAGEMGMKRVLDCPGLPSQVLDFEAERAAVTFGVNIDVTSNSLAMVERKKRELAAADVVLCCSEFQRERLLALNPIVRRAEVIPLWTDVDFWSAAAMARVFAQPGERLRVLCAGTVSLRKGVPYLLQAVEPLAAEVSLTLVGSVSPEMESVLKRFRAHRCLPYLPKDQLRSLCTEHDLLVMPTLGDSFGFVITDAMASGMPVIASRSAGAPLPDEGWRVPAHDAEAIRTKLLAYHTDRDLLRHDAEVALVFGRMFPPTNYRAKAAKLFAGLLAA
jgi:glycosyltransferase involved in cell wall biosynthesis